MNHPTNHTIAKYRQALKIYPQHLDLYLLLGKELRAQGKLTEAISVYQQSLAVQPRQAQVAAFLGQLFAQQGTLYQASYYYQQALALQPQHKEWNFEFAIVLHQLGSWHQALIYYRRILELEPDDARVHYHLGLLYNQRGQPGLAAEHYRQAIALKPNEVNAYNNLGCVLIHQEKLDAATQIFLQALELDPTWATVHNNLGQVLQAEGEVAEAIAAYQRAIELEPQFALAHRNLGQLWQRQGEYERAEVCYEQIIALEPENVAAYSDCASVMMAQGKLTLALNYFRAAIALQPEFATAYCRRANLLGEEDLLERAQVCCARFLQALQQHFTITEVCYHLWQAYLHLGDVLSAYGALNQAESYYHKALQIAPQQVELYLRLGNCLAQQGRFDGAVGTYHLGLTFEPQQPQLLSALANLLAQYEQPLQAIAYYEQILQLHLAGESLVELKFGAQAPELPHSVYPVTRDWVAATQLQGVEYWTKEKTSNRENGEAIRVEKSLAPRSDECGGVTCSACMTKLCRLFEPLHLSHQVYQLTRQQPLPVSIPATFVVSIPQGRAWIAPKTSEWLICKAIAIVTPDDYLLGDVSRHYPWYLPNCSKHDPTRHELWQLEQLPEVKKISGKVAILSSLSAHVYYHWMIDVLPRLDILKQSGLDWGEIDYFVVNSLDKPFQRETLQLLEINTAKVIESDQTPHIQAEQLLVPSFPGHLDWVPESTINFLRQSFLDIDSSLTINYPARIYISRARAKYRQVINEAKITALLKQKGFQVVHLETMSVREQAALFAAAKTIIAPHGAGLTNLVFCSPQTQVVELFSPNYIRSDYWMISHALGLEHYYLKGESFGCYPLRQLMYQSTLTEDFIVNLEALKLALQALGIKT